MAKGIGGSMADGQGKAQQGRNPRLPARPSSRHGRIFALSMMKDEGPYLLEWVAHHLAIGFTDLLVYTNDCSDGTDAMLERLEQLGLAHHRRNEIAPGMKPQPSALNHAQAEPLLKSADWLMVFDADEFLSITHGDGTLDGLIDGIEARGGNGMVVTWRIFGSAGITRWSPDFVTTQFLRAAPRDWNKGWGVKTLFRHDPGAWKLGIHRPSMRNRVLDGDFPDSVRWLNGSGQPMEEYFKFRGWRSIIRTVGHDWAQMNHYAVKSREAYALRRLRGNVNNKAGKYGAEYWALQDRNEDEDGAMLAGLARRRAIFEGLLSDPELRRLHQAAVAGAEARLAALRETEDYVRLMDELEAASAVPIEAVSAKPPKPRDPEKVAAQMAAAGRPALREPSPAPVALERDVPEPLATDAPWHDNHGVALPADPGGFTPAGLAAIAQGKFARNLARNLPKLGRDGAGYAEIGAGCGFLGQLLARQRPDMVLSLAEGAAAWRELAGGIAARNGGPAPGAGPDVSDAAALAGWLAARRPAILVLGDPGLRPSTLETALARCGGPALLIVTGRLWAIRHPDAEEFARIAAAHGLTRRLPLDPGLCAGFAPEPPGKRDG